MKALFLDIDGVLNSETDPADFIDPAKVALVNEVCVATGAVVVVSSEWRQDYNMGHDGTTAALRAAGLTAPIHGFTDTQRKMSMTIAGARYGQILRYLREHPDITVHAVIDDSDVLGGRVVRVNGVRGIEDHHAARLIEILGKEPTP